MKITSLFVAVLACSLIPAGYAQQAPTPTNPKRIPISVAVESEGPQGEWAQSAQDLTKKQLQKLEGLIGEELSKQENLTVVDANDPKNHLHVAVVAAQVEHQGTSHWVIVSSVLTMADEKGNDLLVTHDVIAGPDLLSVAHTVGFQVASAVLRLITGIK
jgi:hypothetical protein